MTPCPWIPTEAQQAVLTASDDLLVIGGAGSGKTTIALEKARRFADESEMASEQRVPLPELLEHRCAPESRKLPVPR